MPNAKLTSERILADWWSPVGVGPTSFKTEKRGKSGFIPEIEAEYAQNVAPSQAESSLVV
jgi:hypothetical protein